MPFLSKEIFTPHAYEDIKEGVLPSIIAPEIYQGWIKKFERTTSATTHRVTYKSDDKTVTGIMLSPATIPAEGAPIILFNRGGRGRYGMLNILTINNLLMPLVDKGYIVLAAQYRGVDGGEGEDEFGGSEVQDITSLHECAIQTPEWDGKNIYFFGWSRGGMMTLLALKHGAQVNAASLGAPLIDLTLSTGEGQSKREDWLMRVMPNYKTEGFKALEERSAPYWMPKLNKTPLLLMHGDADEDVSILHSRQFAQKLSDAGHKHKLVEYEGGNHYLNRQRREVLEETHQWFMAYKK